MKTIRANKPLPIFLAALTGFLLIVPSVGADGFRSANRNPVGNSVPNPNIDRRPDGDRPVTRDIKHPGGPVTRYPDYVHVDVDRNRGFWAGLATGVLVGAVTPNIPPGARRLDFNGGYYYYVGGYYYQETPAGYEVVQPPVGTFAAQPPPGAIPVVVGAYTYFYFNGAFYLQQGNVFKVVAAPIGATVPVLPAGASQVLIGGAVYYHANGVHYRPSFQNGATVFTTVKV